MKQIIGKKVRCETEHKISITDVIKGVKAPIVGNFYTVRGIIEDKGNYYITLVEIVNPKVQYAAGVLECYFDVRGFSMPKEEPVNDLLDLPLCLN